MRIARSAGLALALLCAACQGSDLPDPASFAPVAGVKSVAVVATRFVITLEDGRTLRQDELAGAVLTLNSRGEQYRLRIDSMRPDPRDPAGEITLYELAAEDSGGGAWHNPCLKDPDGQRFAFPLAGVWTRDGRHLPAAEQFSITCTSGAEGKCVRFGYKPWNTLPDGRALWDFHVTCTRMLRADYCGDAHPHTRDGTPVDLWDHIGLQRDEPEPGMSFEAAWGPQGAVCVRRVRYRDLASDITLGAECPALRDRIGEACGEDAPGGLLFNKSFPRP